MFEISRFLEMRIEPVAFKVYTNKSARVTVSKGNRNRSLSDVEW